MSDDQTPAPPPTTHADDRELGYGAVDARPDGAASGEDEAGSGEVAGAMNSGGQSSGRDYADAPTPENQDGDTAGQSHQGYSGGDNPNATSTREATHDRAS